ncbi:hypothetical protein Tco_0669827 [Tanacetum coccineum]
MFLYMDQLQKQLDNEESQEIGFMSAFKVLETQFQMFIKNASSVINEKQWTESKEQDTTPIGNDSHADEADIKPIFD